MTNTTPPPDLPGRKPDNRKATTSTLRKVRLESLKCEGCGKPLDTRAELTATRNINLCYECGMKVIDPSADVTVPMNVEEEDSDIQTT